MSHAERILAADDDANALYALAELLRDEGYDVDVARSAAPALATWVVRTGQGLWPT